MSKTTKIIAALGVVAGLGVAALPAFTYAAEVSGNVELDVEVDAAIAMTITGNNDANASTHYDYAVVANPQAADLGSYYETSDGKTFTLTADSEVVPGKTYFTQTEGSTGVDVFAPYSEGKGNVAGHSEAFKLGPSSSSLSILPNSIGTMTSTVTVYTNNASGYTLSVKDADNNTNLVNDSFSIPAAAAPAAGAAGWSIEGGSLAKSAITAAGATVKTTASKTEGGDVTTMTYTVSTAPDQATGTYTDTIVYTAATNNGAGN